MCASTLCKTIFKTKEKWKHVSEMHLKKKEKKEQAVFEFILQGLLFSDRLSDRRQCFHGAVPVGNQRREEFAAHCNKGLVRLESS